MAIIIATAIFLCADHATAQTPTKTAAPKPAPITFSADIKPFLTRHCIKCHGEKKQKGKLAFHKLDPAQLGTSDSKTWTKMVEALAFGEMPPEKEPQPPKHQVARITAWIKTQLAAAGKESDVDHKLQQPVYANLVNHRKLFDGKIKGPAFSPPRLWRLHPQAYEAFLSDFGRELTQGGPLSRPFTVGDGKGIPSNYAGLAKADAALLGQLMLNCKQIAILQTTGFKKMQTDRKTKKQVERIYRKPPATFAAIMDSQSDPTDEQLQAAVHEEFQIILTRKPSEEELAAFTGLLKKTIAVGGKERGLRTMAMAVMLRPEAIYRMEIGLGKTDEHGRRMLSPYELAHAIAYALTDTPPGQLLLGPPKPKDRRKQPTPPSLIDLAESGKLSTREDVKRIATQIWETQGIKKPRILRFFQEFFGYHRAGAVFKGDRGSRSFSIRHIIKHCDALVLHIVNKDKQVLKELLTTEKFFFEWPGSEAEYQKRITYIVNRTKNKGPKDRNYKYFIERPKKTNKRPIPQANPSWRETAKFYNLDPETWDYPKEHPFPMPEGQRCGILTHPAWLVAWSGNFGNDPIRRGKWIREHLLADNIPEVPITVDASVPEDHTKTLRQRLTKTKEAYCWNCHKKMNPLGLPFESYTDFGRFRTKEGLGDTKALGKVKSTAPVVTTGAIIDSGDTMLDGEVKDVRELMHKLANSDRVRQSLVRHAFRYWMGRNEMFSDSPTLMAADAAYVKNQGSFKALVIELLTSDSFLYRK